MKLYNIVKVYTSTVGTGTVTLGSAVPSFITFATAGVVNGSTVSYAIEDGNNREVGTGTYTSGAETLTRSVVTSTNSNNLITLSGNAVVFITGLAADLSSDTANVASTLVQRDGSGNFAAGAATLSSAVVPLISGGTTASSILTLQSTSGAGTSDAIIFRTASQLERMRVSTAGDVNIGSANNAGNTLRYFDVYNTNTGSSAGVITRLITSDVAGTGAAIGQIIKYKNGTMLFQNSETDSAASMQFYVGASERMRIDSSGNVAIGTTSTPQQFTLGGYGAIAMVTGNTYGYLTHQFGATNGADYVSLASNYRRTDSASGTIFNTGAATSEIALITAGAQTNIAFSTNSAANTAPTERMRIDFNGSVGIGTSSPGEKLVVVGNIVAGNTGTTADGYIDIDGGATGKVRISRTGTGATASGMVFYTQFSTLQERMRILSTGEVGIGTSSPGYKLHVLGADGFGAGTAAAAIATSTTGNSATTLELLTGSGSAFDISLFAAGASPANAVYFNNRNSAPMVFLTGNSERMRIDSSGNLLVGTTSALARLTVSAGTAAGAVANITSGQTGTTVRSNSVFRIQSEAAGRDVHMQFSDNVTNATEIGMISGSTYFCTGAVERMRIDSSGNVGIGTSSPTAKVNVLSNRASVTYGQVWDFYNGGSFENSVILGFNGSASLFGNFQSYPLTFHTNASERMRIDSVGNVKVGGTADRATTAGTNQVVIFNGTAPVGTLANGCSFYSTAGEMRVMDAAGNATLLSPHDSVTNEWIYDSSHTPSGKRLKINVERLLRFINDHFGLDCVHDLMEEA